LAISTAASDALRASIDDRLRLVIEAIGLAMSAAPQSCGTIARRMSEVMCDACVFFELSRDGLQLSELAGHTRAPTAPTAPPGGFAFAPVVLSDHAAAAAVIATGEPALAVTADLLNALGLDAQRWGLPPIRCALTVALRADGAAVGTLSLLRCDPNAPAFDADDRDLAQAIADAVGLSLHRARAAAHDRDHDATAPPVATPSSPFQGGGRITDTEASDQMFRAFIEAAPDAMVIVGDDGRIVLVNRQAEKLFGYGPHELVGRTIEALVPERFQGVHPSRRDGYFQDPRTRPMGAGLDLAGRRKDGSEFPAEISLSPLQSGDRTLVTAAIRDITNRRRAEQKFRSLLEAAPDAIVIVDGEGRIVLVNAQTEKLFGYPRAELLGQSVDMLIPARYRDRHEGHRGAYFANPRARGMGSGLDLFGCRKNGTEFAIEISLSPLETEDGMLVSSAIRDVTERKMAEVVLARAKEAAESANRELEAFSSSVAHDLRAPLRGMNGFARLVLETYADKLDDEGRDWLNEIQLNARKMGALIDALLLLARVTRTELHCESVDLSTLARSLGAQLAAEEPERQVELVIDDGLRADLDPQLARIMMENLLGNAWKFTSQASAPRIELGVREEDGRRELFLRDNGAGFDMAYAKKLFTPFQRLHTVQEFSGTGIGLATVQRIIRRHGGRIWAEGRVGEGATFYFTLPVGSAGAVS